MMKLDTILIPLDGSKLAEQALTQTLDLTRDRASTLVLVRAAIASAWPGADPTDQQIRVVREAEEYLDTMKAELAAKRVQRVQASVWYGEPAPAIIEAARVGGVDLIVMTTHGRSGVGRLVLGSVAEAVLRGTSTPILLVRADGAPVQAPEGGAQEHALGTAPGPVLTVRGQ
jgi:nucleotide-binding universal stress UspA family protein